MDVIAIISKRFELTDGEIWYRMDKGAIFCHVNRIIPEDKEMPCVTSGTQK